MKWDLGIKLLPFIIKMLRKRPVLLLLLPAGNYNIIKQRRKEEKRFTTCSSSIKSFKVNKNEFFFPPFLSASRPI